MRWYIKHLLDPARFVTETVPVQFQSGAKYDSYNGGTARYFFQDHHTLRTNYDSYNDKTGQSSTCT